jgi:hypothetical protein
MPHGPAGPIWPAPRWAPSSTVGPSCLARPTGALRALFGPGPPRAGQCATKSLPVDVAPFCAFLIEAVPPCTPSSTTSGAASAAKAALARFVMGAEGILIARYSVRFHCKAMERLWRLRMATSKRYMEHPLNARHYLQSPPRNIRSDASVFCHGHACKHVYWMI